LTSILLNFFYKKYFIFVINIAVTEILMVIKERIDEDFWFEFFEADSWMGLECAVN
jgi:hypothetical protein